MLLKLYCLGAALALMPLPTQPLEPQQETLFLYISRDITNTTFPFDLNVTTNSDVVLVKCSHNNYRHKDAGESFSFNTEDFKARSIFNREGDSFAWVPLLKSKSVPTYLKCGRIHLEDVGNPRYDWIFNVKWINNLTTESIANYEKIDNSILRSPDGCGDTENTIIFASNKKGGFTLVTDHRQLKNLHTNQMYYYFVNLTENEKFKGPCSILKAYNEAPKFLLPDYTHTPVTETSDSTISIDIAETEERPLKYHFVLGNDLEDYSGEKISLSRMRYLENGPNDIENSNETIISTFTIKGYDKVKRVYNSPFKGNFKIVSKKYYFSPKSKNIVFETKTESYFPSNSSAKPNCTRYYSTIGYLHKISYNGTEGSVNTLNFTDGIKGNFNKTKSYIFFKENADGKTTISCTYKTLDGTIKTTTNFVNEDTIAYLKMLYLQKHLDEQNALNDTLKETQIALDENNKKVKSINETLHETQKIMDQKMKENNITHPIHLNYLGCVNSNSLQKMVGSITYNVETKEKIL